MYRHLRRLTLITLSLLTATTLVQAEPVAHQATLKAHAILPAQTFAQAPEDAPYSLTISGRFGGGQQRNETLNSYKILETGLTMPFVGQPVQGFSGIRSLSDDRFLVVTDNGFGSRANSSDALLMFHTLKIDWEQGQPQVEKTIFLQDPDRKVPFPIVNEHTPTRYLTGADFDLESIQPTENGYWFGEEFGPFIIHTDKNGVVLEVVETVIDSVAHRSPDNPYLKLPSPGEALETINTGRSGGYEGMAISQDGTRLYPLLEKPFYDTQTQSFEQFNGTSVLRIFEYNIEGNAWSDQIRYYPLESSNHAIGDFNMIDDNRALIIERDNLQGDPRDQSVENPAQFKRVYLVNINQLDENGVVEKLAYIDLMAIEDQDNKALEGTIDRRFNFPFFTIEDVDRVDETTLIIANDNNYPYSSGRQKGRADNNEFILLDIGDFLTIGQD